MSTTDKERDTWNKEESFYETKKKIMENENDPDHKRCIEGVKEDEEMRKMQDPFVMMKKIPRTKEEAIMADEAASRWNIGDSSARKILTTMIAAGYVKKVYVDEDGSCVKYRFMRTIKPERPGTSDEVLDFIRNMDGASAGKIRKYMMLELDQWKKIRNDLAREKKIKETGHIWSVI